MKPESRMFWLVWNDTKGIPKHKHWTKQEAKSEAMRLALANPGQEFHVLALVTSCAHNAVMWREPAFRHGDMEEETPF